jgi:hypothetical protein
MTTAGGTASVVPPSSHNQQEVMNYISRFHCPQCFIPSVLEHDGRSGRCAGCGVHFARHECGPTGFAGIPQAVWLPLATAAISRSCPACGTVIRLSQRAEALPDLPDWFRPLLDFAKVTALTVGGAMVIGGLVSALQRRA